VATNRWFNRGQYEPYKRAYGGMFNVWLGTGGLIEAIIKDANEFMEVCLTCDLEELV
jgi:hypothetical protein